MLRLKAGASSKRIKDKIEGVGRMYPARRDSKRDVSKGDQRVSERKGSRSITGSVKMGFEIEYEKGDIHLLPTSVWVEARMRILMNEGMSCYVIHKGPPEAGAVLVKCWCPNKGARIYTQCRDMDGQLGWMSVFDPEHVAEKAADTYIKEQIETDPDLWVIEVELSREGNPFSSGWPNS